MSKFSRDVATPIAVDLIEADEVHVSEWQAIDVSSSPAHITSELINVVIRWQMPKLAAELVYEVQPDLPWAEDHFLERVSGKPLNPPPSAAWWPYHGSESREEEYSHTYPERYWASLATHNEGIRFPYGDLDDVVMKLRAHKHTRQAWLPVWFPEDTWAMNREHRVPCTIGYQFLIRKDQLHVNYYIRSCDFVRHFHNDVYMTVRLGQWMLGELIDKYPHLEMGELFMVIGSLHSFAGDRGKLQEAIRPELRRSRT